MIKGRMSNVVIISAERFPSFGPHIFLRSRGLSYDDLISYRGKLSQHKIFIDYDVGGGQEHPCAREINYHTELFLQRAF